LGGRIVKLDGRTGLNIPITVQGASSLPVVGGVSVFKPAKCAIPASGRSKRMLVTAQSVATTAESDAEREGGPHVTRVKADIKTVRIIDTISIKQVVLNLTSTHKPGSDDPQISLGECKIAGLKLGAFSLEVKLDLSTLRDCDTKKKLSETYERDADFRRKNFRRFNTPEQDRKIKEYSGEYYVCSIVDEISGDLPKGARIDEDGYTIHWPGIGRIVLGEMLISRNSRRLTMVRVQLGCQTEGYAAVGEGEVNGGGMP
jgi:hypothetical protein